MPLPHYARFGNDGCNTAMPCDCRTRDAASPPHCAVIGIVLPSRWPNPSAPRIMSAPRGLVRSGIGPAPTNLNLDVSQEAEMLPDRRRFVILGALTTMRKSEILRRSGKEVHSDRPFPYVEIPITKNDDPRIIPRRALAVAELKKRVLRGASLCSRLSRLTGCFSPEEAVPLGYAESSRRCMRTG
jgi:hypothetical protein